MEAKTPCKDLDFLHPIKLYPKEIDQILKQIYSWVYVKWKMLRSAD